jgi:hypothetical protein
MIKKNQLLRSTGISFPKHVKIPIIDHSHTQRDSRKKNAQEDNIDLHRLKQSVKLSSTKDWKAMIFLVNIVLEQQQQFAGYWKHNIEIWPQPLIKTGVLESVITVVFQNTFRSEIHQNNIFFYFLKFIFDISTSNNSKT